MPAYRSSDEAEVRDAAVSRLRSLRPTARIIHEINNGCINRVDVLAVSKTEIIALEVKSKKDTLDLLDGQIKGMSLIAHHTILAVHESLLDEVVTNQWAARAERDGAFYRRVSPVLSGRRAELWVYPELPRDQWRGPNDTLNEVLPASALEMIWKDELITLCHHNRLPTNTRTRAYDMRRMLLWNCSGRDLVTGICATLRARNCIEADPAIPFALIQKDVPLFAGETATT